MRSIEEIVGTQLVEPVVSSFPFARHLRRFTCKPKHTITVHAYARVQCTEQKQPRHPTRERGMAEMGAKRTKFSGQSMQALYAGWHVPNMCPT
jgi:hypothetical protein